MRKAYTGVEWIFSDEGKLLGFGLGFDHCAEHEWGVPYLKSAIGFPDLRCPNGIEDRTMTRVPQRDFGLVEYKAKAGPPGQEKMRVPHALLYLAQSGDHLLQTCQTKKKFAAHLNVDFWRTYSREYEPARDDVSCAWSSSRGFAIHVRGSEYVDHLRTLYEALRRGDVALLAGKHLGSRHNGWTLAIASAMSPEQKDALRASDRRENHLKNSFDESGIVKTLKAAGKEYYALSPRWRGGVEDSELMFWLNPSDQRSNHHGWFTLEELLQWAKGKGPVVEGRAAQAALRSQDPDYNVKLLKKAEAAGIGINHMTEVWLDAQQTQPGLRVLFSTSGNYARLKDGRYSLQDLHAAFDATLAAKAAQNTGICAPAAGPGANRA